MGGRGSGSGLNTGNTPFKIPKVTKKQLGSLNRSALETLVTAIYANRAMEGGLSREEGVRRARALMDGNTTEQLRKYIAKYGKPYQE